MAKERTGLFQLPRDPEKALRILSSKPVDQLLADGLSTDENGRITISDAGSSESAVIAAAVFFQHVET